MDLKKEFFQRNIKQETENEPYNSESFASTTNNVLQIKFEDPNYGNDLIDQIENTLEAIVNAHHTEESPQLKECKNTPLPKNVEKQICRLCAQPIRGNAIFLFQEGDLQQKINYTLPITASLGDGLPEYICVDCETNLNKLYDFVCLVVNADKANKAKLNGPDVKSSDVTNATIKLIFGADSSELLQDDETSYASASALKEKKPSKHLIHEDDFEKPRKIQKLQQDDAVPQESAKSEHQYKCQHCDQHFPDYFAFIHHNKQSHKVVHYPCPEIGCPETFTVEKALRQHIKDNHNVPVICYRCGKIFAYQEALQKHKANMHFLKVCDDCGMTFKNLVNFNTHQKLHKEVDPHQCVYCYKNFNNRHQLHRHTRQRHTGNFTLLLDTEEDEVQD